MEEIKVSYAKTVYGKKEIDAINKCLKDKPTLKSTPNSIYLSHSVDTILRDSERYRDTFQDKFISVEHLLLAISTSGKSKNIIRACQYCKKNSIKLITLTGVKESQASNYADIDICTPNGKYSDRVQELHTLLIHIIVESVEKLLS